jgi:hypothetical protein
MPTPTYTPLATVTLGSSASSVTFSSIPTTYRDLILVIAGGVTVSATNIRLTINSDTTDSNYSWVQMSGTGSSTISNTPGPSEQRYINYYGYAENDLNMNILVNLFDYSATDKHKTYLSRSNQADNGVTAVASRWANTSAVTSLQVSPYGGSLATGSTFSLYGVIA